MGSVLDDPAVVDYGDPVGPHGGGQPVGDEDGCPALQHRIQRPLDHRFREQVQVRRGLVEDQHPGTRQEGSGQGHQLALTGRQRRSPLVDRGVYAVRHPVHQPLESDGPTGLPHLFTGGSRAGKGHVVPDRPVEQERLLGDNAKLAPQRVDGHLPQIVPIDGHVAERRIVEADDEFGDG